MKKQPNPILKFEKIVTSAPCRVDMGGTFDISTFYYPLSGFDPCTFNIALNLRTTVTLIPHSDGKVKVTSRGFKHSEYPLDKAPYRHPLGLIFALAAFFRTGGVHIIIDSSSPPRSALGGSSVAAVAVAAALAKATGRTDRLTPRVKQKIALLAQRVEESVAGVPCGLQDQLAAAYGGVNAWHWQASPRSGGYKRKRILHGQALKNIERHLLLAYCGAPHESRDINSRWVGQFLRGGNRDRWIEILACTNMFIGAIESGDIHAAVGAMNKETAIRRKMTPDVLDAIGKRLVDSAARNNCGARFTGAGGGGCIWAIGGIKDIDRLKGSWEGILSAKEGARLLDVCIDTEGLRFDQTRL